MKQLAQVVLFPLLLLMAFAQGGCTGILSPNYPGLGQAFAKVMHVFVQFGDRAVEYRHRVGRWPSRASDLANGDLEVELDVDSFDRNFALRPENGALSVYLRETGEHLMTIEEPSLTIDGLNPSDAKRLAGRFSEQAVD